MKVRVTKCYLVQVINEDGDEEACEYVFAGKENALHRGQVLKREVMEEKKKQEKEF